ncbi:TPM domain-containing protein [Aliarcobacter butzleri]|uniref:TPM domain-containing protein n=1 Tax=Aliarcobacter butzleri TaxID=28197 RepID=UPI001EDA89F6|nr:TPM domain-containing protein [Aliarcobacter butzleri]MCG3661678.1 TPM domain-containing protein [Aliarcobacter butzleri]MCG3679131.1 TPM domain-containing protein [Aliarcobacter butzleri]MCT7581373.1 TPM domain-containing protein [Aliarcobacter butzleri]MDN5112831.1 TPM domain-containing protein [Aliarcobacter butzleri]
MKKIIIFLLLILNFLNADISQHFPKLEGRVIDEANLLSPEVKKDINNILKNEENKSSNQIVVVILNSLNGYSIEEFSYQLGRFWGIGQKDKNNGVLLVVSMKEREIRIEVGYGLEGALTDKISHEIINYTIKPNFKASQYELGILKAVNEIIKATQGEYVAKPKNKEYNTNFPSYVFYIIILSSFIATIIPKQKKFLKNIFISPIFSAILTFSLINLFIIESSAVVAIIFFLLLIPSYIIMKNSDDYLENNQNIFNSSNHYIETIYKGFSGGGGSFGGGGASGRW